MRGDARVEKVTVRVATRNVAGEHQPSGGTACDLDREMRPLDLLESSEKDERSVVGNRGAKSVLVGRHAVVDHVPVAASKEPANEMTAAAGEVERAPGEASCPFDASIGHLALIAHDLRHRGGKDRQHVRDSAEAVNNVEPLAPHL